jgi:hypothetical protein
MVAPAGIGAARSESTLQRRLQSCEEGSSIGQVARQDPQGFKSTAGYHGGGRCCCIRKARRRNADEGAAGSEGENSSADSACSGPAAVHHRAAVRGCGECCAGVHLRARFLCGSLRAVRDRQAALWLLHQRPPPRPRSTGSMQRETLCTVFDAFSQEVCCSVTRATM